MQYNVFTDFHHASLLNSFILLFEKRLGGVVYRPIGTEWFEKGFWKVYDHPETVAQFLGIGSATPDGTRPLNDISDLTKYKSPIDGLFFCNDIDSGSVNKAITFESFMKTQIDIVIASIPSHIEPFNRLCQIHPSKPRLIYQIGNQWDVPEGVGVKNVMASAKLQNIPVGLNLIQYHQEFDLSVFSPDFTSNHQKSINSFVNVFNGQDHFKSDYELFLSVEKLMPEWRFKSYGGQCRDGAVGPSSVLADTMKKSRFIWHTKQGGDGYGHIIHNVGAVGRPLIVKKEYYHGKMGEGLMQDGQTCIAIDGLSVNEIVNKIEYFSKEERYSLLCKNSYENFKRVVDFDREFEGICEFLENLQ